MKKAISCVMALWLFYWAMERNVIDLKNIMIILGAVGWIRAGAEK